MIWTVEITGLSARLHQFETTRRIVTSGTEDKSIYICLFNLKLQRLIHVQTKNATWNIFLADSRTQNYKILTLHVWYGNILCWIDKNTHNKSTLEEKYLYSPMTRFFFTSCYYYCLTYCVKHSTTVYLYFTLYNIC